jgi:hypothetical protein
MLTNILYVDTDDGDVAEVVLPTVWAICYHCRGDGSRALGGLAITASEWAEWDDEDRHAYRTGGYDTPCEDCGGSGKVSEVDEDALSVEHLAAWHAQQAEEAEYRSVCAQERAMGA